MVQEAAPLISWHTSRAVCHIMLADAPLVIPMRTSFVHTTRYLAASAASVLESRRTSAALSLLHPLFEAPDKGLYKD